MYCKNCGNKLNENDKFCPSCGKQVNESQNPVPTNNYQVYDSGSFGWALLGFFIPIVGIILYFCWNNTKPKSAKWHFGVV